MDEVITAANTFVATVGYLYLPIHDFLGVLVDHKLRSESTKEAKVVKDLLKKILIASDHAGFKLKEAIKVFLSKKLNMFSFSLVIILISMLSLQEFDLHSPKNK